MVPSKTDSESGVATHDEIEVREPSMFQVVLLNDNYTSMEFVLLILEQIFHQSSAEAQRIMLAVHNNGSGVAGVYPKEIAETKMAMVHHLAKQHEFPLRCTISPV